MISVVIPVYRCGGSLDELHRRLIPALETLSSPYEIVFVDDACPEGSAAVLARLARLDSAVVTLSLVENVGQQRAVLAGLARARGTSVVVMDGDLQDSPEAIPSLLTRLDDGFDAVFAGRRGQHQSRLRLLTSTVFKHLLGLLCGTPADAGLFVVMSRRLAERLSAFEKPGPSVVAMIGCVGLPSVSLPVVRARRTDGRSGYSSWKRLKIGFATVAWVLCWKIGGSLERITRRTIPRAA